MSLISATRTVIKAAAIVIFGYGVGWLIAEFDTQRLALEMVPAVSGNQTPPLSSCEALFRQSDLAKRLGKEFGLAFINPPVLCGDEVLLVVPSPPVPAPVPPQRFVDPRVMRKVFDLDQCADCALRLGL